MNLVPGSSDLKKRLFLKDGCENFLDPKIPRITSQSPSSLLLLSLLQLMKGASSSIF